MTGSCAAKAVWVALAIHALVGREPARAGYGQWVRLGEAVATSDAPATAAATAAFLPDGRLAIAEGDALRVQRNWGAEAFDSLSNVPTNLNASFIAVWDAETAVVGGTNPAAPLFRFRPSLPQSPAFEPVAVDVMGRRGVWRDTNSLFVVGTRADGSDPGVYWVRLSDASNRLVVTASDVERLCDLALAPDGALYVGDSASGEVRRFSQADIERGVAPKPLSGGQLAHTFGAGPLRSVALDALGRLWAGGASPAGVRVYSATVGERSVEPGPEPGAYRVATFMRGGRSHVAYFNWATSGVGRVWYGFDLSVFYFLNETFRPFSAASGFGSAYDEGVPGFVGPHGPGKTPIDGLNPSNAVNPVFTAWAARVVEYAPADEIWMGEGIWNDPAKGLGPVSGDNFQVVSLGDLDTNELAAGRSPGSITLGFDVDIVDGDGPDFVVFENGFTLGGTSGMYELGYVEVSSDGARFARFPAIALTPKPVGAYGHLDPRHMYGLCGKHANAYGESWGTPFDLADLFDHPLVRGGAVDLRRIRYVRIVDVPGSGAFRDDSTPSRSIHDAWPTSGSGGLDLDAVGVIHSAARFTLASAGDGVACAWQTETGRQYRVQWTSDLCVTNWTDLTPPIAGDGGIGGAFDPAAGAQRRYYRIVETDGP